VPQFVSDHRGLYQASGSVSEHRFSHAVSGVGSYQGIFSDAVSGIGSYQGIALAMP
jgi:hypothetical protein